MPSIKITTTISQEIAQMAMDRGIKWSVALKKGILDLINEVDPSDEFDPRITIDEDSPIAKKTMAIRTMQDHINDLNNEIEELRK